MSIIFHIDVNSAYLSWTAIEQLKTGSTIDLRLVPAIIGGDQDKRRGVVLAKSIPAKQYGIQTGEPAVDAFRKCPGLIAAKPDHELYSRYSQKLMEYLRKSGGIIEQVSVDECFLDVTRILQDETQYLALAKELKEGVKKQFGFTVNVGISTNKLLAKMASDFQKPDLIHTLFKAEIKEKMWPLPISELYMAGKASVDTLKKLEINTIGDLALANPQLIELHLKSHGRKLWEFANGIDDTPVKKVPAKAKGIGSSTTLPTDVVSFDEAKKVLTEIAGSVSRRLKRSEQKAANISVEIKYNDFTQGSHQRQLSGYVQEANEITQIALELFDEKWDRRPIRLLGIRSSKLVDQEEPEQLSLFDIKEDLVKNHKLKGVMEELKAKYGKAVLKKGTD
ncbi:MAG TPA: DNA polymerase IV [Candidatus Dorea intestinavium]|nr:DNA polymerase IV [Candidatus Dorea intestinavium]